MGEVDLMRAVADEIQAAALRVGVDAGTAAQISGAVDARIRQQFGGDRHYLPARNTEAARARALRALAAGESARTVAEREGVTERTVYLWRAKGAK